MSWFKMVILCAMLVGIGVAVGCVKDDIPLSGTGGSGGSTTATGGQGGTGGVGGAPAACKLGASLVGSCVL